MSAQQHRQQGACCAVVVECRCAAAWRGRARIWAGPRHGAVLDVRGSIREGSLSHALRTATCLVLVLVLVLVLLTSMARESLHHSLTHSLTQSLAHCLDGPWRQHGLLASFSPSLWPVPLGSKGQGSASATVLPRQTQSHLLRSLARSLVRAQTPASRGPRRLVPVPVPMPVAVPESCLFLLPLSGRMDSHMMLAHGSRWLSGSLSLSLSFTNTGLNSNTWQGYGYSLADRPAAQLAVCLVETSHDTKPRCLLPPPAAISAAASRAFCFGVCTLQSHSR